MKKQKLFQRLALPGVAFTLLAVGGSNALATPLPILPLQFGELDVGQLMGALVGVSTTTGPQTGCVNFNTTLGGSASPCSTATTTNINVSGLDSKDFTFPSTGTIRNIPQGIGSIISWETVPGGTNDGGSGTTVFFDLTGVPAAILSGTNDCVSGAVGSNCAPTGSPFSFKQISASQIQIGFVVDAIAYTGTSADGSTPYIANFSTTLSGTLQSFGCVPSMANNCNDTIPNLLLWEAGGGSVESGWTATESPAPVPEPISLALFGSGLVAIAMLGRRKRRT